MTKFYRRFEQLELALLVTFMSGFINAYSYNTQGGRFAGVQTGNVLMMMIFTGKGEFSRALTYLLPIVVFIVGQFVTYFLRQFAYKNNYRWHAFSAKCLLLLLAVTAIISPYVTEHVTIALLALFASIQLETFKRIHHLSYGNVMMTGNLKQASLFLVQGLVEKDEQLRQQAYHLLAVIASFMLGVLVSTGLTTYFYEQSLYLLLIPMLAVSLLLKIEKPS